MTEQTHNKLEALKLSLTLLEKKKHESGNNMIAEEVDQLKNQIKELESEIKKSSDH